MHFARVITLTSLLKCADTPSTCHPWCHMFERAFVVCVCLFTVSLPLVPFLFPQSTCSLSGTPSSISSPLKVKTIALTQNEEYCSMKIFNPLIGYWTNVLDDFHYTETSEMLSQDKSGDKDTEPSYLCDAGLDDEIFRYLRRCSIRIDKNQRTWDKPITLMKKVFVDSSVCWFSAKGNWSHYCRRWTISTRPTTSSWTTIKTKLRSSWSSFEVFMRWKK